MLDKLNQYTLINAQDIVDHNSTAIPNNPAIADQQDIDTFNNALNGNLSVPAHPPIPSPIAHLASLEAEAMNKLQNLSTSLNPGDYMKTARSLSAYQLESLVTTKVISKSTQAIEKLTSLQ